jgi:thiamine-phosphate pyrophosphorylase
MDLEFTPALQIAWNRAARIAGREQRSEIEPIDLLRGLLAEDEGHAALRLAGAGLSLAAWQARHPEDLGLPSDVVESPLAIAPALRLVMVRARQEIGDITDAGSLSTDQVLGAILALAGSAREVLQACGLDPSAFESTAEHPPIALDEPLDLAEPTDVARAARIVDAAANRVREALRVLEDHCRFVRDDALLSAACKELRHDLAAALTELPAGLLLASRDTERDVGTSTSTEAERSRDSLGAIVAANAKRLQEGLRSLEEYGKLLSGDFGTRIERLRYASYTLEKSLILGEASRGRLADARLYALVTEPACRTSLVGTVRELVEGGVDVVQLREKGSGDRAILDRAREIREITRRFGVLFVMNDRPDLARLAEADGVHLGQDDLSVSDSRRILGPGALVGVSTHSLEQLRTAVRDGASYLGVGPTFASSTKTFAEFPGIAYVREAAQATSLPAFAIGGITLENVDLVLAAGATRIAVSAALCAADDPRRTAQVFKEKLRRKIA